MSKRSRPDTGAILRRAIEHHRSGRLGEAESLYRQVLAAEPDNALALRHLGLIAQRMGAADAARRLLERAAAVAPLDAEAHNALGAFHAGAGRNAEAQACFRRAVALDPVSADALRNLGTVLIAGDRAADALEFFERARAIEPLPPEISLNHARALEAHGRLADAETILRGLIARRPDWSSPATNLGMNLEAQGRHGEAEAFLQRAVQLAPDSGDAHYNLALHLLATGHYERGWREHEWRRRKRLTGLAGRAYDAPLWAGEHVDGTLYVYWEQGFGDIIQFARFLPEAARRARRLCFECPPRLARLLRGLSGADAMEFHTGPPDNFDTHCGLMSLPFALGVNDEAALGRTPYLAAEPDLVARWRDRLGATQGLRIGIAWQGSPTYAQDAQRSIPLAAFAPLARIPGVELFSLQKGLGSEQIAAFDAPLHDLAPQLDIDDAFVDTAAVVANLDLVVTSDTSLAHLAGAMGARAFVALPFAADWRWRVGRDDTPWYATLQPVRQSAPGDWPGVFARIADAIVQRR